MIERRCRYNRDLMSKPTRDQAEKAVKTLIEWAGDNPEREGLVETPKRVVKAYEQFFEGYDQDPEEILTKTFEEVEGYDEMVIVKDIRLESHCEHHIVPILGKAHIGYIPNNRVVGISKLARIVDVFGKRLQTQETMTSQIANVIQKVLKNLNINPKTFFSWRFKHSHRFSEPAFYTFFDFTIHMTKECRMI